MNKCLECVNYQVWLSKNGKPTMCTCSKHRNTIVYGEVGNEPIVEDCGAYKKMKVYKK